MSELSGMNSSRAAVWRVIDTGPLCGAENMAVDEALLKCFDAAVSLPVLRLYGWQPPALSLGRFQQAAEVLDLQRCRADGVPVVRRITGGGVIYHADELTYAIVCAPSQLPAATSVKDSFRELTAFLLLFYRTLGLQAVYAADNPAAGDLLGVRTPFCFAGRETFDIIINGRKIGGNAQRRLKNVVFQHGSIPLVNRAAEGLEYMRDRRSEFAEGSTCLSEFAVDIGRLQLCDGIRRAFSKAFGVELREELLSEAERDAAAGLLQHKYSNYSWNMEGVEHGG